MKRELYFFEEKLKLVFIQVVFRTKLKARLKITQGFLWIKDKTE